MEDFQSLLMQRVQILVSATFVFFFILIAAWRNGYFRFQRPGMGYTGRLSSRTFLGAFAVFLILQLLIIPLSFQFWYYFYTLGDEHFIRSAELQGWTNIYGILISGLGMAFYFFALPQQSQEIVLGSFAFKGFKEKIQDFFIACISWIVSYPLVVAVGQIIAIFLMFVYKNVEPEQVAVNQIKMAATSNLLLTTLIICVIFLVPIVEELLFRGFLQNWLKGFMKTKYAVLLTSLIFALFHFAPAQGMGNIELILSLFVLSCFLGFIYERQKSLWAPISLHAIFNAISIALIFYVENEK